MDARFFKTIIVTLISAFLVFAFSGGCDNDPPEPNKNLGPAVVLRNSQGQDWLVTVELARTGKEQARGLMYRWSLPEDHGMLFVYHSPEVRSFWMKNTRIPLDMIFIGPDKKIAGIVQNAEPYSLSPRKVSAPSQWVLEVAGGECERHRIKAGDRVYFFGIGP